MTDPEPSASTHRHLLGLQEASPRKPPCKPPSKWPVMREAVKGGRMLGRVGTICSGLEERLGSELSGQAQTP